MVRSILNRRNVIACLVLSVVGYMLAAPAQAKADNPLPVITVQSQVIKQKVNANQYKAKLRITATLKMGTTVLATNTFETAFVTLPRAQNIILANLNILGIFKFSGSMKWTGTEITAKVHLEVNWFGTRVVKDSSVSVGAD